MDALKIQVAGDHYKNMKIQPMEYSMANGLDACQHSVVKYVSRFRNKGGIADLEKAKHCIDMLIDFEKSKKSNVSGEGRLFSKEDFIHVTEQSKPANDNAPNGWIEWLGGENPVPGRCVEYRTRVQARSEYYKYTLSDALRWSHRIASKNPADDIVAYKVID